MSIDEDVEKLEKLEKLEKRVEILEEQMENLLASYGSLLKWAEIKDKEE